MAQAPTRDEVFKRLAKSALDGYLGLFVGTGFSIALTNGRAPNFKKLLQEVCGELNIAFDFGDAAAVLGKSFPQVASSLVELRAREMLKLAPTGSDPDLVGQSALNEVRQAIATKTNLQPDPLLRAPYKAVLAKVSPSWIVTTNYDFILEALFDRSTSLLPENFLLPSTKLVPIYHLHGHRRRPESIVVTEEDYVGLFGPLEYRQLKLTLLVAESSTVMLGYSLGDINVRAALSWARGFLLCPPRQPGHGQGKKTPAGEEIGKEHV
ncbi:MAG: SIR2 family protein [Deltaproteobacteria bacterium]|nr:SIR2 family protein [Deltaproteobacteria bacterium]